MRLSKNDERMLEAMRRVMNIDLDELDWLAQAATPGPWEVTHGGSVYSLHGDTDGGSCEILYDTFGPGDDSAYIAAASPDVVRALIARVRAAEAERDRLRKLFDDAGQGEHNVLALVDYYQQESREARAGREWQPIETAPVSEWVLAWGKRGTYGTGEVCTMVVRRDEWGWGDQHGHAFTPTHWRPLPAPPGGAS